MLEFLDGKAGNRGGVTIPVKLAIYRLDKDKTRVVKVWIDNQTYNTTGKHAAGINYIERRIASHILVPGVYHVRLETMEDISFLKGREIYLEIREWRVK
jgi:hypothetical protein